MMNEVAAFDKVHPSKRTFRFEFEVPLPLPPRPLFPGLLFEGPPLRREMELISGGFMLGTISIGDGRCPVDVGRRCGSPGETWGL